MKKKKTPKMLLGEAGEEAACSYLAALGQTVIERNCRRGHLEIDIVTTDRNGVHFVEVKSRLAPVCAAPQENVTPCKRRRIVEAALRYLSSKKDPRIAGDLNVSFDVVAVVFDGMKMEIEYFPNAWYPIYT